MTTREKIIEDVTAYGELAFWTIFLGVLLIVNLPYEYVYLPLKRRREAKR